MILLFRDCELDVERRQLQRAGEDIHLEPQVFDLLTYLVAHRDRVISKDEIIEKVWRRRIVSDATLSTRINAVRSALGDDGKSQRFLQTLPRRGFRFVAEVHEQTSSALSDKPSIAILPFQNLSSDPEQDYFADGMVEEITTGLSRLRWLLVIARNSSFTYKGRAVDVRQVGRELGVRYVLEGSVRKAADRVRITGQLIDASTGMHLWADRFEGALAEVFELQDLVTGNVVGAIGLKIEHAELERARRKPTENLDAYDCFLRGRAALHAGSEPNNREALDLFCRASELDTGFAAAYALAAYCYVWRLANGWTKDRARETEAAVLLARRAAEFGQDDAEALCFAGFALARAAGDLSGGGALLEKAIALNPNLAAAWGFIGRIKVYRGEPEQGLPDLARAMRLSPLDPENYGVEGSTAYAHYFCGRYGDAAEWGHRAMRENAAFLPVAAIAAASSAMAGRPADAKKAMERLRQIAPTLRITNLRQHFMFSRDQDIERLASGLRKAALPE